MVSQPHFSRPLTTKEIAMDRIRLVTIRLAPVVALLVASGAGSKWGH